MSTFSNNLIKVIGLVVVALLWFYVPPETALLWSVFLIWLTFRLDERILGGIAILFLICIPVLLALGHDARAEQMAVYVFFLLCMTVALQIFNLVRGDRHDVPKNNPIVEIKNDVRTAQRAVGKIYRPFDGVRKPRSKNKTDEVNR